MPHIVLGLTESPIFLMPYSLQSLRGQLARYVLVLLLPALIFAQWVGLAHRIAHTGWDNATHVRSIQLTKGALSAAENAPFFGEIEGTKQHSCAAFDAITLGQCIHSTALLPVIFTTDAVVTTDLSIQQWHAIVELAFSSRAPPLV